MKSEPKQPAVAVAIGILERGGLFLVARRPPDAHLGGLWEFPGGRVEAGETVDEALRREIAEETGLSFREALLLHVREHQYAERAVRLHYFLCLEPHGDAEARHAQGAEEASWVTPRELEALPMPDANTEIVRLLVEQYGES